MQEKEICRVIDKNPEESNWKKQPPSPIFCWNVRRFGRWPQSKTRQIQRGYWTDLSQLVLRAFLPGCTGCGLPVCPRPPGWLCAGLGWRETLQKNSWTRGGKRSPTVIPRTAKPQSADDLIFAQIRDSRLESGFVKSIWMFELVWFWSLIFEWTKWLIELLDLL